MHRIVPREAKVARFQRVSGGKDLLVPMQGRIWTGHWGRGAVSHSRGGDEKRIPERAIAIGNYCRQEVLKHEKNLGLWKTYSSGREGKSDKAILYSRSGEMSRLEAQSEKECAVATAEERLRGRRGKGSTFEFFPQEKNPVKPLSARCPVRSYCGVTQGATVNTVISGG